MSALIPRLSEAELPPELAQVLRGRVERLGYLGEFFRCTAHQPGALRCFVDLTEDLKRTLPDNLTEVVALSVAALMKNAYERVQHERLSLKLGFGKLWVRQVLALEPDQQGGLAEQERLVERLALAVVRRQGHGAGPELEAVIHSLGHQKAVAILMLIGRYVMHALIVNSLELAPPVPSPLERKE